MILEIPRIPESPNEVRRFHWRYRYRHDSLWREIWYAVRAAGPLPEPYTKARVQIERRSRGRLDPDNLVACMKPVIDALRHANVLADDTEDHIRLTVTQSYGLPRTRIEVTAVRSL